MSAALVVIEDTALAIIEPANMAASVSGMDSESLGVFVRDGMVGVATKLVELKPYVEELWTRLDNGEVILGCSTKKEFCAQVLQRTPRAVRYMLEGGNHNRGETVSPAKPKKGASPVTDAEFADYEREHPDVRKITKNLLATMTPTDTVGALVGMNTPEPMAEAAVRAVAEQSPAPKNPSGMPESLQEIRLDICDRTDPRYEEIREDHYVENHGCIGQQAHFLIHYRGELAGIISGASAAYATSSRDKFFGITKENRHGFLQGIVDNTVFRLENHEPNLATRVLRLWREIIPHIWYEKYGVVVYGFETFVVENDTRKGALYKADNWTLAGTTSGATKIRNGIENPADNWKQVVPKLVYCKWRDGFTTPCSARTHEWVQRLCGDVLRSSEQQPWKPRTIEERQRQRLESQIDATLREFAPDTAEEPSQVERLGE